MNEEDFKKIAEGAADAAVMARTLALCYVALGLTSEDVAAAHRAWIDKARNDTFPGVDASLADALSDEIALALAGRLLAAEQSFQEVKAALDGRQKS